MFLKLPMTEEPTVSRAERHVCVCVCVCWEGGGGGGEHGYAHLHLATLDIQAPEVQLMDSKFGQDGAEGHAGDDLQRGHVHFFVPFPLEAVAHEFDNAGSHPCVHPVYVLVGIAGRHPQSDVILAIARHLGILHSQSPRISTCRMILNSEHSQSCRKVRSYQLPPTRQCHLCSCWSSLHAAHANPVKSKLPPFA